MGQKVNPISMRLQLNKNWASKWYADKQQYTDFLRQDLTIRKMVNDSLGSKAAINRMEISRTANLVTVTIYTAKAGIVIGKGGNGATMLKTAIEKITKSAVRVNIEELKKPELYAKLTAENIAHQLERRMNFRRAIKSAAASTMRAGALGVRIEVAGRLNGADMSRREKEALGSVPLHTIRADIDFAFVPSFTPAGIIGVKVWIYKGERKI